MVIRTVIGAYDPCKRGIVLKQQDTCKEMEVAGLLKGERRYF